MSLNEGKLSGHSRYERKVKRFINCSSEASTVLATVSRPLGYISFVATMTLSLLSGVEMPKLRSKTKLWT